MRNEPSLTFSNFFEFRPNCNPYPNVRRKHNYSYIRLKSNKSVGETRQSLNEAEDNKQYVVQSDAIRRVKAHCRKILRDTRISRHQDKVGLPIASEHSNQVKLITDTSVEKLEGRSEVVQTSVIGLGLRKSTADFSQNKRLENEIRFESPATVKNISKKPLKLMKEMEVSEQQPSEILTITKIDTSDSVRKYYGRLLQIYMQNQQKVQKLENNKVIHCKIGLGKPVTSQISQTATNFIRPSKSTEKNPSRKLKNARTQKMSFIKTQINFRNQPVNQENIVFLEPQQRHEIYVHCADKYLPRINAQSFIVLHEYAENRYRSMSGYQENRRVQIASLTKIMTCLTVLKVAEKWNVNLKNTKTVISQKACRLLGTSAQLQSGDILPIQDLLYGLMLPSGNDAAVALAEWCGKFIRHTNSKKYWQEMVSRGKSTSKEIHPPTSKRSYISLFILHMNRIAKSLRLENSHFANCHGLNNKRNFSTAEDIAKLVIYCLELPTFQEIVQCQHYTTNIMNRKYGTQRNISWNNTNKLLRQKGFIGVKTGITPAAGPCLASAYRLPNGQKLIGVVLNTPTIQQRFEETRKLIFSVIRTLNDECDEYNQVIRDFCQCRPNLGSTATGSLFDKSQPPEDCNNFEPSEDSSDIYDDD